GPCARTRDSSVCVSMRDPLAGKRRLELLMTALASVVHIARAVGRRFPAVATAALVFAHDPQAVTATPADRVGPLFQPHFRAGCDPSTLKRGRIDGELSHGNYLRGP